MARDMTEREFNAALAKYGFKKSFGFWFEHPENPGTHFGGTFDSKTMKLRRRETLAHLIKRKGQNDAKRAKERKAEMVPA